MEMGCPAPREGGSVCLLPLLRACPQPPRWLGVALDAHGSCHLPPAPSSPASAPERVTRPEGQIQPQAQGLEGTSLPKLGSAGRLDQSSPPASPARSAPHRATEPL